MAFYGCISKIKEKIYKKISHLIFEKVWEDMFSYHGDDTQAYDD